MDVANYIIPNEKVFFYIFNPFDEYTMHAVVSNILDSIRIYPRTIYIGYLKPVHRHIFDLNRSFNIIKDINHYVIYSVSY